MAGDISAKELLDKLHDYHQEIVALTREVTSSIRTLESARQKVEESEKKFWVVHKNAVTTAIAILSLVVLVFGLGLTMRVTNLCVVHVTGDNTSADLTSCK